MEGKFKCTDELHKAMLDVLLQFKTQCEFNAKDFEAVKIEQYKYVREEMARMFPDTTNKVFFGPVQVEVGEYEDENEKKIFVKNELKKIDIGYKRVQNKIKDLRQGYSKAVLVGRRSGSGKLVCEFYNELTLIWAGAPNTQPLPMGISSSQINSPDDVDREEDITDDVTLAELYDGDIDFVSTPQSKKTVISVLHCAYVD